MKQSTLEEAITRAEAVVEALRRHDAVLDDELSDLVAYGVTDHMRGLLDQGDADWLVPLVREGSTDARVFGLALLHGVKDVEGVRELVLDQWQRSDDYRVKMGAMWRLLDFDIDRELHKQIYRFVRENWEPWVAHTARHVRYSEILSSVVARLGNESFPEAKAWVYLCVAMGAPDTDQVERLLSDHIDSSSSIVSDVARDMLEIIRRRASFAVGWD